MWLCLYLLQRAPSKLPRHPAVSKRANRSVLFQLLEQDDAIDAVDVVKPDYDALATLATPLDTAFAQHVINPPPYALSSTTVDIQVMCTCIFGFVRLYHRSKAYFESLMHMLCRVSYKISRDELAHGFNN